MEKILSPIDAPRQVALMDIRMAQLGGSGLRTKKYRQLS